MISVVSIVLAGLLIGRCCAKVLDGWKSYAIGVPAALIIVPTVGYLAAHVDGMLVDGTTSKMTGTAAGLVFGAILGLVTLGLLSRIGEGFAVFG